MFYRELLRGTIGSALVKARRAVHARRSPDWADYVHYGDAEFRLKAALRIFAAMSRAACLPPAANDGRRFAATSGGKPRVGVMRTSAPIDPRADRTRPR